VAGFKSEWWPESNRNGGRLQIGIPGRIASEFAAIVELKEDGELWHRSRLRQSKYLNNIVEQDHRRIKRLVHPGLGFGSFRTARRTLAGVEAMAMIRKRQVRNINGSDIRGQATFIAGLFGIAA
jgi:hypothetical protein